MEIWKRVPNYNRYKVSNTGLIKTFDWKGSGQTRIMKPSKDNSGYLRTMLKRDDGIIHTIKVHRIVAQTFIENTENKPEINHLDACKTNNNTYNLEWCTRQENIQHSIDNGLMVSHCGEKNGCSKLKEHQVKEIRNKFKPRKYTRQMLADEFNVKPSTIKDVILRKSWKHLD
jgi:transcriptional regulator CtsR